MGKSLNDNNYLVAVDYMSNFLEVDHLADTRSINSDTNT